MGLRTYEKLRIEQDLANGEMRFKIEEVNYIEYALSRAKAIEAALLLISAQRTSEELANIGGPNYLFNRDKMLDEIILYARKTLKGDNLK